jgi:hypothetical protein
LDVLFQIFICERTIVPSEFLGILKFQCPRMYPKNICVDIVCTRPLSNEMPRTSPAGRSKQTKFQVWIDENQLSNLNSVVSLSDTLSHGHGGTTGGQWTTCRSPHLPRSCGGADCQPLSATAVPH